MAQIMASLASGTAYYAHVFWTYKDPRSAHLPLMDSPVPVLAILAAYFYFVFSLGPRLMQNRPAYNPQKLMMAYNAVQVVFCAHLITVAWRVGWGWRFSWTCEPLLPTQMDPIDFDMAYAVWMFFILKIVDLLDTVFMVIKKNNRQITFLHVYHHAGMVLAMWWAARNHPGGGSTLMGPLNCIVHCVLYGYYLVSILEPRAKAAWWKKYITLLQLVQFAINFVHEIFPFITPGCQMDLRICALALVQNAFMLVLFGEFYYKNFVVTKPSAAPGPRRKSD